MNINRNNYEVFFIDFYEEKLTAGQKRALALFLSENPDLKEEFENYETVTVPVSDISFPAKDRLKKPEVIAVEGITEENYEEHFIAYYENDLGDKEQKSLQSFLGANPQLQKEFGLHKALILPPDEIIYAGKSGLKKKAAIGYYWYATAAAAVILLFLAFQFLTRQNTADERQEFMEIAQLRPMGISGNIASIPNAQPVIARVKVQSVRLPEPERTEKSAIPLLASAGIETIVAESDFDAVLENISFDYYPLPAKAPEPQERKSLLAKIFRHNLSRAKEELGIERNRAKKDNNEPGIVRFLDGSLMVFNTITGSETELVKNYDENGKLRSYELEGETVYVSRKVPPGTTK